MGCSLFLSLSALGGRCALGFCFSLLQGMGECSRQGKVWGRVDGQIVFLLQQVSSLQEGEKVEDGCYCSAL